MWICQLTVYAVIAHNCHYRVVAPCHTRMLGGALVERRHEICFVSGVQDQFQSP